MNSIIYLSKVSIIVLFFLCESCDLENLTFDTVVSGKGTIVKSEPYFLLNADNGIQYFPTNLSDEFKINNLKVEFSGYTQNSKWSLINEIDLTFIKKLNENEFSSFDNILTFSLLLYDKGSRKKDYLFSVL